MQSTEFVVIYDILQESFLSLSWSPLIWLIGSIFVSLLFFADVRRNGFETKKVKQSLSIIICLISITIGIYGVYATLKIQQRCLSWAKNKDFQVVQGQITKLKSETKHEAFTVEGKLFDYREYNIAQCGYKQYKGIKLKSGDFVRVSYRDNCILKLEVAK